MKAKYVDPFSDFGFKKNFGEEPSKPMLKDFLNSLLPDLNIITLNFIDKEKTGNSKENRKSFYYIYCETDKGEKIIVEFQKVKQNYFKDSAIYYSTFPIQEQAEIGNWDYKLKSVFCIGILNFKCKDKKKSNKKEVLHTVQLKTKTTNFFMTN